MDIQVVARSMFFRPVHADGRPGLPGTVLFRYSNAFPFAVRLFFPEMAVEVNRQVLADGIDHEASDSDVTVKHLKSGSVEIEVRGRTGVFRVRLPRNALIDALDETWRLVEQGREFDVFDVDLWLSRELPEAA